MLALEYRPADLAPGDTVKLTATSIRNDPSVPGRMVRSIVAQPGEWTIVCYVPERDHYVLREGRFGSTVCAFRSQLMLA